MSKKNNNQQFDTHCVLEVYSVPDIDIMDLRTKTIHVYVHQLVSETDRSWHESLKNTLLQFQWLYFTMTSNLKYSFKIKCWVILISVSHQSLTCYRLFYNKQIEGSLDLFTNYVPNSNKQSIHIDFITIQ